METKTIYEDISMEEGFDRTLHLLVGIYINGKLNEKCEACEILGN